MNEYTVEYKMVYKMTQVVEADSEEEALSIAQGDEGGGIEGDAYCTDWEVTGVVQDLSEGCDPRPHSI